MRVNEQAFKSYFNEVAGFWDDVYSRSDVYSLILQERAVAVLNLVDALNLRRDATILEIGCGAGHLAVELARRGFRVCAIDSAPAMLSTALARAQRNRVEHRVDVRSGDVQRLEFDDARFDVVLAIGVLPWVNSLEAPLREMARVTRPGGFVLTTIDHRWAIHRLLDPRINPLLMPTKRALGKLLASAGVLRLETPSRTHSRSAFYRALRATGLRLQHSVVIGFGPFTFLNVPLLSQARGVQLHRYLQTLADRGFPVIQSAGAQYIALARRN